MRKLIAAMSAAGLGLTTLAAVAPTTGAAPPPGATVTASPTPSDAQATFDDSRSYQDRAIPFAGVDGPDTNTRIRVVSASDASMRIKIGSG